MRLGVISDSHGELDNLRQAAFILINEWKVDKIVHLGDECEDTVVFQEYPPQEIIQVHGVYCSHYQDPSIINRPLINIEGHRCLFTHTDKPHRNDLPEDPDPQELARQKKVDIIFYGHSHIPEIRQQDGIIWLNPGHLKNEDKKGFAPSFAVAELLERKATLKLIKLHTGEILEQITSPV